jgi:L-fuconolactonase
MNLFICDSQVHAPQQPGLPERPTGTVATGSFSKTTLAREMAEAGVSRAIIVPYGVAIPGGKNNEACLKWASAEPQKYAVMGVLPVEHGVSANIIAAWKRPGMLGMRISLLSEDNRALLLEGKLDVLWEAAADADLPIMANVARTLPEIGEVAASYPRLRLIIDHMAVLPFGICTDFGPILKQLLPLARYPNIAVKLSRLPAVVDEPYPFPSLHQPVRRVIDAFGPQRLFWGSDLTTHSRSYAECVRLFTEALPLTMNEKEWIMGRAVCEWLEWPIRAE